MGQKAKEGTAKGEVGSGKKTGRNDPCPCGSGKKYKRCCLSRKDDLFPSESKAEKTLETHRAQASQRAKELFELIGERQYSRAFDVATTYSKAFPKDDRVFDAMVTALLMMNKPEEAYQLAFSCYEEAKREKEYFMLHGQHSWEVEGPGFGYGYAPEAWLEKVWVSKKAVDYKRGYPTDPDPRISALVEELMKAEDLSLYPQGGEQGLKARREGLSGVLEGLIQIGPKALPYILPVCPRYGWSGLLIPNILGRWGDESSIRALIDISMFHYPYLSESALKELESKGEKILPYLRRAFEEDREFDPLKTGLLSVANEIKTEESMLWLVEMLGHPSPFIVNWTAGLLGKSGYRRALPALREALTRVGDQPYLLWAIEELGAE